MCLLPSSPFTEIPGNLGYLYCPTLLVLIWVRQKPRKHFLMIVLSTAAFTGASDTSSHPSEFYYHFVLSNILDICIPKVLCCTSPWTHCFVSDPSNFHGFFSPRLRPCVTGLPQNLTSLAMPLRWPAVLQNTRLDPARINSLRETSFEIWTL